MNQPSSIPPHESSAPEAPRRKSSWGRTLTSLAVLLILCATIAYAAKQCMNMPVQMAQVTKDGMVSIAEKFKSGKVVQEFRDRITTMEGTNHLVVARLNSTEAFNRSEATHYLWDTVPVEVEIEAIVPVEYSYFINLNGEWQMEWNDESAVMYVTAPPIEPNKPAVAVSDIQIRYLKKSVWRDEDKVKERLVGRITEETVKRADEKIPLIRELARSEVKKFIEKWVRDFLLRDTDQKAAVEIVFADEIPAAATPTLPPLEPGAKP